MLTPTFVFVVILSTIGGLQLFTEPLLFGNGNMRGGTQREFQTLAMYMYEKGINSLNTAGYGAAIALALFVMIGIVAVDQLRARPPDREVREPTMVAAPRASGRPAR